MHFSTLADRHKYVSTIRPYSMLPRLRQKWSKGEMRSLRSLRYCTLRRSPKGVQKISKVKRHWNLLPPLPPLASTHLRSEPRTSDSKQAWIRHQSYLQVRQYNVRWIFGCATIWRSPASHSSLTPNQGPNFKPFLIQYSLAKQIGENHFSTFSHDSSQHIP